MAQRLVLSVDQGALTITQLKSFLKRAEGYGVKGTAVLRYTEDEGSHMLTVPIPDGVVPRRFVKRKKKKERDIAEAADKQIKARKEAVAKGEVVTGHVPPVKGVKKTKKKKRAKKTAPAKAKEGGSA